MQVEKKSFVPTSCTELHKLIETTDNFEHVSSFRDEMMQETPTEAFMVECDNLQFDCEW
ncbi:MAG: hypothetical protein VW270_11265 [Candidatus Poseidoniales archaeon]